MVLPSASVVPAGRGGGEAPAADAEGLLAQVAAGPGLWEDWLGGLGRGGLVRGAVAAGGGAGRADLGPGIGATWHGMETTGMDGTTIELFSNDELADAFGVPASGTKPKIRIAAHVRTGSRRWIAAAAGGYHDGENTLADQLEASFTAGIVNLADRGFFSMDRWIRFSGGGAHLIWRVKNGAKSVPFKTLRVLSDGSELVLLRESASMLGKRRRDVGDKTLPRLPDPIARLVSFTVPARTARRVKTTTIKVLTTLLDPAAFPAREIAALYAERWQAENAHLHLT